jgi:hypothetical protein
VTTSRTLLWADVLASRDRVKTKQGQDSRLSGYIVDPLGSMSPNYFLPRLIRPETVEMLRAIVCMCSLLEPAKTLKWGDRDAWGQRCKDVLRHCQRGRFEFFTGYRGLFRLALGVKLSTVQQAFARAKHTSHRAYGPQKRSDTSGGA